MSIGKQLSRIREAQGLTQEDMGNIFHVTRQTISNWENEKSYPDLQTLVSISDHFQISLDTLLKEDSKMVRTIDWQWFCGEAYQKAQSRCTCLISAGIGLLLGNMFQPVTTGRIVCAVIALEVILGGLLCQSWLEQKLRKKKEEWGITD